MAYVDGFLLPVAKDKVKAYLKIARIARKVWMEHGALEYRECVGDDLQHPGLKSLHSSAAAKENETVILAWIVFKSRKHRDRVNAKAMVDPRLTGMKPENLPFDCQSIAYGGFKIMVEGMASKAQG
jgi:uncharacterized protein YbaA (DUF1428 family)